ncbi:cysteine desulfurase NifS [bacterium]
MIKVYADNNATTPLHPEVLEAMMPYLKEHFGNASSLHVWGRMAREAVDNARLKTAQIISADPSEIYFTSCGTESDNWAVKGIIDAHKSQSIHIITSHVEHHAVLNVYKYLEKKGCEVTYLPVDSKGVVSLFELKKSIRDNTILVSVMYANNETGILEPVKEISAYIKELNDERVTLGKTKIYFHSDAVQALGKVKIDVKELNIDLMSFSAHKINGPKGIGALYIKKGTKINPMLHGGHHENHKRAGTENTAGIVGFGKACSIAENNFKEHTEKLQKLREMLLQGITKNIKEVYINGDINNSIPNTLNVSFNYIEGESVVINLDLAGIGVSSGSACTSGSMASSYVLKAMRVSPVLAQGSIRFSMGIFNTEKDIKYIIDALPPIIKKLREMSPLYKKKER